MSTVTTIDDIAPGTAKLIEGRDQQIAIFNSEGRFFALEEKCSHRGGPLSEGAFDATCVTCPWHGAKFELATGKRLNDCAPRDQRSYAVNPHGPALEISL